MSSLARTYVRTYSTVDMFVVLRRLDESRGSHMRGKIVGIGVGMLVLIRFKKKLAQTFFDFAAETNEISAAKHHHHHHTTFIF